VTSLYKLIDGRTLGSPTTMGAAMSGVDRAVIDRAKRDRPAGGPGRGFDGNMCGYR